MIGAITDVQGIKVGHYTNVEAATGCTVILCEEGAVAGVNISGSSPGTRETELLKPMSLVQQVQAVLLSGGSAFGLDAAGGVMRYLEEQGLGHNTSIARVPIVPAAILFDLAIGDSGVRPNANDGYSACLSALPGPVEEGSVGAGTGATVGKILGMDRAIKSGVGVASQKISENLVVGALMAVNAYGDIHNPETGDLLAGPRDLERHSFFKSTDLLKQGKVAPSCARHNTTIGVVATNALLTKEQVNKLAQMAQTGVARAVRPSYTMYDGDVLFTLSLGKETGDINAIGAVAAEVVVQAIVRAVLTARSLAGIPSAADFSRAG